MKWSLPAKTFLLGEYAAIAEQSAILLTTTPYFELAHTDTNTNPLHADSPGALWWRQEGLSSGLSWFDPYYGRGGLGASSAQYLACYLASCHLQGQVATLNHMLDGYYQVAWSGKGLRPSGYDVIAQSQNACVFINKQKNIIQSFEWPFEDLSFFLLHTGVKLATHLHLQETTLPCEIHCLSTLVDEALDAIFNAHSEKLINCVNKYHQKLTDLKCVATHSLGLINKLKYLPEVLAAKGCGALGADVLLVLCAKSDKMTLKNKLCLGKWTVLACESDLTKPINLFEKKH